ncbi:MAG: hypothetical protein ACLFR2_04580 [Candidatus Kapaibacterium sp.]
MKYNLILILIIVLACANCGSKKSDQNNNSSETYKVIENDTTVLMEVTYLDVMNDKLLFSSRSNNFIALYRMNGELIRTFKPTIDLCDTLALKGYTFRKNEKFILYDSTKFTKEGNKQIRQYLTHQYLNACFIDTNNILISGHFKGLRVYNDNENRISSIALQGGIVKYDLINDIKIANPLEIQDLLYGQSESLLYDPDENAIIVKCVSSHDNKIHYALALFDLKGNLIRPLMETPSVYYLNKMEHADSPKLFKDGDDIFAAYALLPEIYNINTKEKFQLKNIPYDNYDAFDKLMAEPGRRKAILDSFLILTATFTNDIYSSANNTILVDITIRNKKGAEIDTVRAIQEYTKSGEFIGQKELIIEDEYGVVKRTLYLPDRKKLLILRKHSEKGWFIILEDFFL